MRRSAAMKGRAMQRLLRALALATAASLATVASTAALADANLKAELDKQLKSPKVKKWKKQAGAAAKAKLGAATASGKKQLTKKLEDWKKKVVK
jgi:hypothetical protein